MSSASRALLAAALLSGPPARAAVWRAAGSMGSNRWIHTATLLPDGRVLVAGGDDGSGALNKAEIHDPRTGAWSQAASMRESREFHTATLLPNGKVLVVGGVGSSNASATSELYDPAADAWAYTGSPVKPRTYHGATLLSSGKVLVTGGFGSQGILSAAEVYDPALGTWSSGGSMGSAREFHASARLQDGKVLVTGGEGNLGLLSSAETYDPDSGAWTAVPSMSTPRLYHTATVLADGKVLAAGGLDGGACSETFDPSAGAWSSTAAMGTTRLFHTATLMPDGKVLAVGGDDAWGHPLASAEVFDPSTGLWSALASTMSYSRYYHCATLLPGGKLLVDGGQGVPGLTLASAEILDPEAGAWTPSGSMAKSRISQALAPLADGKALACGESTSEVYDPASGAWAAAGAMGVFRRGHRATLLPGGKVLASGGVDAAGGALSSAEVFSPHPRTWAPAAPMNRARRGHGSTLLADGKVLVSGGDDSATAEIYDPAQDAWTLTAAMVSVRFDHAASPLADGRVLVSGGTAGAVLSSAEIYAPGTGLWSAAASMASARRRHRALLLIGGRVLISGGSDASSALASAEVYDPPSGTWISTAAMVSARSDFGLVPLPDGKVLALGGLGPAALSAAEVFDPAASTWTPVHSLGAARQGPCALLLSNGNALAAGGLDSGGSPLSSAEVLTAAEYAPAPSLRPVVSAVNGDSSRPAGITAGSTASVSGLRLTGAGEGSGGNGQQNSAASLPHAFLLDPQSGAWVDLSTSAHAHAVSATALTLDVPANLPRGNYYFWIHTNAPSAFSNLACPVPPPAPPSAPSGQALSPSSIRWTWAPVPTATSYRVYAASDATLLASTTEAIFVETGLSTNTAAGLRLASVSTAGASDLGASATAYTLSGVPSGTLASVASSTSIRVDWTASTATAYGVERSSGGTDPFVEVGPPVSVGSGTSFSDSGLAPSTLYAYRVRAFNGDGVPTAYGATSATATYPPAPAPVLSACAVSSASIRWSWTNAGGSASAYELFTSSGVRAASLAAGATFFLETGLPAALHSRYLRALNVSGQGFSSTASVAAPGAFVTGVDSFTLTASDGKTEISIPLNSLGTSAAWMISERPSSLPLTDRTPALIAAADAALPAGTPGSAGSVKEFLLAWSDDRSTQPLSAQVTVKVPYSDSANPGFVDGASPPVRVDTLRLHTINEATGLWEAVAGSWVDKAAKVVAGSVGHLSIFTAMGSGASPDLSRVRVYPVPFRPNGGDPDQGVPYSAANPVSGIIFDNLPQRVSVKIYSISGKRVASLESEGSGGLLRWDARTEAGRDAASGGYFAVIGSPGMSPVVKKLLIVR